MIDHVTAVEEILIIPTYPEPDSEQLPMFAKHRVHQRSSGNPYPNKVVMSVDRTLKEEKEYTVIRLENRYLRIEILPQLGGRIYSALDKTTGYDFFYKQHVIKPALIGMLGSWISGGCEFNWPCHHRPSTYMPVDYFISHGKDGSVTVWLSEHEPLSRMKGMVGIRLKPGEAVFDTLMKVYNRTPVRNSFLWWENAAVPVNEQYRLFFPPDVHYVQFHYRKNVTSYPVASGVYNGIRMGEGTDISYHKNTRQPTSYFCGETKYDFFGGYDEGRQCGVVHAANHHTSIGKKMFTWAYGQLGRSWEHALTDTDGAYAEMMASSYSGNQPDFAWLEGYESKEFSQSWYPIGDTGIPICATRGAAAALCKDGVRIQATAVFSNAALVINGQKRTIDLVPGKPETEEFQDEIETLLLISESGEELLEYVKDPQHLHAMPETLPDNPTLDSLKTAQECYLAGVHVEQYRDPAIESAAYYREALAKDPAYAPALVALARYEYTHARFPEAYELAKKGYAVLTARNYHPESGEPAYILGLASEALANEDEAQDWYQKASWNQDARSRAMTRIARIDGRNNNYRAMENHAQAALQANPGNTLAIALLSAAMLNRGKPDDAYGLLDRLLQDDPENHLAYALRYRTEGLFRRFQSDACQTALDLAGDLCGIGETQLAYDILCGLPSQCAMTGYMLSVLAPDSSAVQNPSKLPVGIAYPSRLFEIRILEMVLMKNPADAVAEDLLACALYNLGQVKEAARLWEKAIRDDSALYSPYRNLAVAYYSSLHRQPEALALLRLALERHPHDQQLIWELTYLMMRQNVPPKDVLALINSEYGETEAREDITIEHARALNLAGKYEESLTLLQSRQFTPCEGGEHAVAEQYMFAQHAVGRVLFQQGHWARALECFQKAQALPDSLGAGLWNEVLLVPHQFYEALCFLRLNESGKADVIFKHILVLREDYFSDMYLPELECWQAMVYMQTDRPAMAAKLTADHLCKYKAAQQKRDAGYFKTTPFFISYQEPADKLRDAFCNWQLAMSYWAQGDISRAAELAETSLQGEPTNLYARLLIKERKGTAND